MHEGDQGEQVVCSDTGEAGRNLSSMLGPLQVLSVVPGGNLRQWGRKGAGSNGSCGSWLGACC